MSTDLNQCNFIGRVGKPLDLKYMQNGTAVANFSIACGDDYKDKATGNKVEQTNWVRVVAFGRLAEIIAEYCGKGSRIFVSGKQVTRKWQDQSGIDRYTTEIIANKMQILDSRGGGQQAQSQSRGQAKPSGQDEDGAAAGSGGFDDGGFDDDIPF